MNKNDRERLEQETSFSEQTQDPVPSQRAQWEIPTNPQEFSLIPDVDDLKPPLPRI